MRAVIPGHGAPFTEVKRRWNGHFRASIIAGRSGPQCENALKVLIVFKLLERQQIPLAELGALFEAIPVLAGARERYFGQDAEALAEWAVHSLVRAGAAKRDGELLVNREF